MGGVKTPLAFMNTDRLKLLNTILGEFIEEYKVGGSYAFGRVKAIVENELITKLEKGNDPDKNIDTIST